MLQNNALTGVLFMVGIGLNSIPMLLGGLFGCVLATQLGARLAQPTKLDQGLYGFNGALVGIAGLCFFQPTPAALVLVAAAVAGATLLTHLIQRTALPGLTAPFLVTTWLMLMAAPYLGVLPPESESTSTVALSETSLLTSTINGIAQVMFQNHPVSGLCFLVGLALSNRRHALLALIGSLAGYLALALPDVSGPLVAQGLYGFSPALTAIVLGSDVLDTSAPQARWPGYSLLRLLIGIGMTLMLTHLFMLLALPALTAPFVLTIWIVLGLERFFYRRSASI